MRLTDAGRTVYAEVHTVAQSFRASLFDGLDPAQLDAAVEVLETLRARIEDAL